MTDRLKAAIDLAEGKPKLKDILLKVAALPEHLQDETLDVISKLIERMRGDKP